MEDQDELFEAADPIYDSCDECGDEVPDVELQECDSCGLQFCKKCQILHAHCDREAE